MLCAPGTYVATLHKYDKGDFVRLAGPVSVTVEPMMKGTLNGSSMNEVVAFWRSYEKLNRDLGALRISLSNEKKRLDKIFIAAMNANVDDTLLSEIDQTRKDLNALDAALNGNPAKNQIGERNRPLPSERLFAIERGISKSTYGPTETHKQTMQIVRNEIAELSDSLGMQRAKVKDLGEKVVAAGGSWVEGID